MTARARVEYDVMTDGLRLSLSRPVGEDGARMVVRWSTAVDLVEAGPEQPLEVNDQGDVWLRLDDDQARAVYEALAGYYGHTGHDMQALRNDYMAERDRVDSLLGYVTDQGRMTAYAMATAMGLPLDEGGQQPGRVGQHRGG